MAQVELKGVRKVYPGGVEAVKDACFTVEDKEFMVLVGPSGCGKSTILRLIAGLEEVTAGDVFIGGQRVNEVPPKNRDIAMVFQNYALYPHMTVFKNMAFGLILRKRPKKEIQERVREAAAILGIEHLLDRKPRALSGGERQRVAVGRAIVRQPKVFLFDEPLSNLDAKLRAQMRTEVSKLHHRLQSTMIYVTHDQTEAMTMGNRIVVLLDGEIQQIAPPLDLYEKPANIFVAGFIGSPPMNLAEGRLVARNGGLYFHSKNDSIHLSVHPNHLTALRLYLDKTVVLGIRPADLKENAAQQALENTSIRVTVEVVEPMGAEAYLTGSVGDIPVTARIGATCDPTVNSTYVLDVATERAHYFDADTGKAIS